MSEVREAIAYNITALRQATNITQSKLADILNYSDKAVSKWERGEAVPDVMVLKQIADYFGVSVDYLLTKKHSADEVPSNALSEIKRKNHFIISTLAVLLVWLGVVLLFVIFSNCKVKSPWTVYVCAPMLSCVVALVFNSIWGIRRMNFLIVSLLIWTLIAALHVIFIVYVGANLWQLYLVGIPGQLIVLFSACIKFNKG